MPDKKSKNMYVKLAKNDNWVNAANPGDTLEFLGFYDGKKNRVEATDELRRRFAKMLKGCGEFADDLLRKGEPADFFSI